MKNALLIGVLVVIETTAFLPRHHGFPFLCGLTFNICDRR